jgi:hypothetical protein
VTVICFPSGVQVDQMTLLVVSCVNPRAQESWTNEAARIHHVASQHSDRPEKAAAPHTVPAARSWASPFRWRLIQHQRSRLFLDRVARHVGRGCRSPRH